MDQRQSGSDKVDHQSPVESGSRQHGKRSAFDEHLRPPQSDDAIAITHGMAHADVDEAQVELRGAGGSYSGGLVLLVC